MPPRRTTRAPRRFRVALPVGSLALGLLAACGRADESVPAPPVPPDLGAFDPRAAERIRAALAKVEADPRAAEAWAELGTVYISERLKGPAIECLGVAERLAPREPRWPYRAAIFLAQNGALEAAQAAMERSLALEPGYAPSHARLGNYRLDLGDLDGAERAYRRALELDPSYPGGPVGLARVALQRDRPAEAVALLERLAAADPDSRTFRQLLASARRQLDPSAPVAAESVLADEEGQVWNDPWELETREYARTPAMLHVGQLLEHGRAAEALALLGEERARGGDEDELGLFFATAHTRLGQPEEARRELAAVLARRGDNVRALMLQAQVLDDLGDVAGAVQALERVTALQPDNGGAFAAKASKLLELRQFEPAYAAYRRALELGVRDYEIRAGLGNCLVFLRRWPEALELFSGMLAERPDDGDAWLQLALAQLRSGALEEAEAALARARATGKTTPKLLQDVGATIEQTRARRTNPAGAEPR